MSKFIKELISRETVDRLSGLSIKFCSIHDLPLLLAISQSLAKPIVTQIILNKASKKSKQSPKTTITKSFTFSLLLLILNLD